MNRTDRPATLEIALRVMEPQDFLNFGMNEVAYIKPITLLNRRLFAVHAADGSAVQVVDNQAQALEVLRNNDLDAVQLQ